MKCDGRKIMCKSLSLSLFLSDGKKNNVKKGERGEKRLEWFIKCIFTVNCNNDNHFMMSSFLSLFFVFFFSFFFIILSGSQMNLEIGSLFFLLLFSHSLSCTPFLSLSLSSYHLFLLSLSLLGRKNINVDVNTSSRDSSPFNS